MIRLLRTLVPFPLLTLVALAAGGGNPAPLPETPKKPVTDEYHGVKVTDNYRWLDNADDPDVKKWTEAQNKYTRSILDAWPGLKDLQQRVKTLLAESSPDHFDLTYRGGKLFAMKTQPPKDQPFLVTLKSLDDPGSAKVIVDPNTLNPKGTTAIDFFVPSRDGKLVAVSLSEGGSETGDCHFFEVETGKKLPDVIPRIYVTGSGSLIWNADNTGVYYTRNPREGEKPKEEMSFYQQVYFHKLGTKTEKDAYQIGKELPKIAEVMLDSSEDGRYALATVQKGDGGEFIHYLRGPNGVWKQITQYEDRVSTMAFGPDQALYLHTTAKAPRGKILRLPLQSPSLDKAAVVVPESDVVIDALTYEGGGSFNPTFVVTGKRLYVLDIVGGPSRIRVFDLAGKQLGEVPLGKLAAVSALVRAGNTDSILFRSDSFLEPPAWYLYDAATGKTTKTALARTSPANFHDCEVEQKFVASKDGTKVPLHILRLKTSKLDGNNPTLLYGYGGYGISMKPHFNASLRVWLEQGGVYALANIRGGGEYGEEWRKGAQLTKRQNAYDDFAACAKYLIDEKYTTAKRLAIRGGSNGGLLMGVQLTQHPELYRAVVSHVGIYDMLRSETFPNGAFNVTEYGTVKDPEQFKALLGYSPYHHVKEGTAYPAVFLLTGANDTRVDPSNSRKMAALLQTSTSSKLPVLLLVGGSGHGLDASLSDRILETADVYAFLFRELDVKYRKAP
jgi:prolyl oligopeptidase